jgi:CMP-N-acetylneuraminic acid synthetase
MKIIALIPARGGSKRVPGKNVRPLGGHPLLFYTIAAAQESGIFSGIYVSSDDPRICYMAELRGATPVPRPPEYATDTSPDIEWIDHFFRITGVDADAFAILRPTSPFRSAETIRRAWAEFQEKQPCDSIRAVEKAKQSPWKMWAPSNELGALIPLSDSLALAGYQRHFMRGEYMIPRHSSPSQFHPTVYAQNASLEISWTRNVTGKGSISGDIIKPFFTQGYEGFDVNTEDDLILAEALIARGLAQLPEVK